MGYSIGDIFANVPNPGTSAGQEQITYIDEPLLQEDGNNFYSIEGIEELASNIELIGLQQPIRVRPDPEDEGAYLIVSGHRRLTAIRSILKKEDPERWAKIPCIVEDHPEESDAMRELRLIFANSDTRKMSESDIDKQAQRVQELLYQLKEEGVEFPGRMRDYVAEACKVSKSKLSRLKVIREGLAPEISKKWWEGGKKDGLGEATAYELARLPNDLQRDIVDKFLHRKDNYGHGVIYLYADTVKKIGERIEALNKLKCGLGGPCDNALAKREAIIDALLYSRWTYTYCEEKCCGDCPNLDRCKFVCSHQLSAQKALKEKKREDRKAEKEAQEEKAAPIVERVRKYWERFGVARSAAGISPTDFKKAIKCDHMGFHDREFTMYEAGEKITQYLSLPLGYSFTLYEADRLVASADALGVSLDYLLCRSDDPRTVEQAVSAAPIGHVMISGWMPGGTNPGHSCQCVADFDLDGKTARRFVQWDSAMNKWKTGPLVDAEREPVRWMELPEIQEEGDAPEESVALNNSCITGASPSGHCGSAHYCGKGYTCCAQCNADCNMRCGFIANEGQDG